MKKRLISVALVLAMISTLFTAFAVSEVAAATVISNTSPAITANVGDTVDLSSYSVVFDGDTAATAGVSWKNSTGASISSVTVMAKGVTKLTATSGSKSKTVYLVAKEASETEYVLFEADFSNYSSITQLKNEGWAFLNDSTRYSLSGGDLVIGHIDDAYARVILPSWLGDFGDYSITANAKMLTSKDTGRWFGLVYRIQNANGSYYPYYHMCVREKTTGNGIEFAERTSSDGWNVCQYGAGTVSSLKNGYYDFNIKAFGTNIQQNLDGAQAMYVTNSVIGNTAPLYSKGMIGLTVNYATVAVSSVKVCVQEAAPERKLQLVNNDHEELPLINPIANVQTVSGSNALSVLSSSNAPGSVLLNASELSDINAVIVNCKKNSIIPTFRITTTAQADAIVAAMDTNGFNDVTVISATASHLSYIRGKKSLIRTGLIINLTNGDLTDKEANTIRKTVRSAPATFCVIESDNATRQAVAEIQEFAVAVWVNVKAQAGTDAFTVEAIKAVTSGANGVISGSSAALASVVNTHLVDNSLTRTPVMIGHRGNPSQAPENSLSGFIEAYNNGADVFEVDVEITLDKKIIIMHDNTINRTTNYTGTKTVNQMNYAEILNYNLLALDGSVSTEKVPLLTEVLDYFKDKDCKIFIEFKGSNASNVPYTAALLKQYEMEYLVDVISFSSTFITQTQSELPGMSTGFLLAPSISSCKTPETALESLYESLTAAQGINSTINPACGVVWSDGNYYTQAATDRGMTVWPWTYTYSTNDIGFLSGCDGVTTDDMQWVTDMAKSLEAGVSESHILVGQESAMGVYAVSYGGARTEIRTNNLVASVLTGNDCVAVVDGAIVGIKEGTAQVVIGYPTRTTGGKEYVVYTQPITITVGGSNALNQLIEKANGISYTEYDEASLVKIRDAYAKAVNLNNSFNANDSETKAVAAELASLLNDFYCVSIVSLGKDYTTTAPNRGEGNAYNDDQIRLTDGSKGNIDGGSTTKYSAWSNIDTSTDNVADVIIDLGKKTESNVYNVYFAAGNWGIISPINKNSIEVFASDDNINFRSVASSADVVLTAGTGENGSWSTYKVTATSDELVSARYIKVTITANKNGNAFIWTDEVEVLLNANVPTDKGVWVNGFNTRITSGAVQIFTPDFGTITTANANHTWAAYLTAKWDPTIRQYVVKSTGGGIGASTPDIVLAEDEIFVVAHRWEGEGVADPVVGSNQNAANFKACAVGDVILFNGIDIENKSFGIAPYISYASASDFLMLGDINGDGERTVLDYMLLKRSCLGTYTLSDEQRAVADINGDDDIGVLDYMLLKRSCLGTYEIK
ncbi:MAG: discoidin domain-containing protein [Clostridia bacterium]|nr:discoidin domain-containing protein [Clostridia bacterium]